MNHELVLLAQKIDWEMVDKEFSVYYPELGRPAVPIRKMVGSMLLKQMYNLGDETFVARWIKNPYWSRLLGMGRPIFNTIIHMIRATLFTSANESEKREHRRY